MNENKEDLNKRLKKLKKLEEVKKTRVKKETIIHEIMESLDEKYFRKLKRIYKKKYKITKITEPETVLGPKKKSNNPKHNKLIKIIIEVFTVYKSLNTEDLTNVISNIYSHKYARSTISEACNILKREGLIIRSEEKSMKRGRPKALWKRGNKKNESNP